MRKRITPFRRDVHSCDTQYELHFAPQMGAVTCHSNLVFQARAFLICVSPLCRTMITNGGNQDMCVCLLLFHCPRLVLRAPRKARPAQAE